MRFVAPKSRSYANIRTPIPTLTNFRSRPIYVNIYAVEISSESLGIQAVQHHAIDPMRANFLYLLTRLYY